MITLIDIEIIAMKNILTIIIPAYNQANFLEKCIKSLTNSVDNKINDCIYEIIVVNDGSTDDTILIAEKLKLEFSCIRIISQENQGLSGARNSGILHCQSEYIMLLDADDWLEISELERLLKITKENDLDLSSFSLKFYDENYNFTGNRPYHPMVYEKIDTGFSFLENGFQPSSACLFIYKTKFIKDNHLTFYPRISQQDVEFTLRLMLLAQKVYFSKAYIYCYYRHTGTITLPTTKEKLKKYLSDSIIVADQMSKNKENNLSKATQELIEKNYNSVIWNLIWRFITKPKEVDYGFKKQCLHQLKQKNLYPIKGDLKTNFQKLTTLFFNIESLLKLIFKLR